MDFSKVIPLMWLRASRGCRCSTALNFAAAPVTAGVLLAAKASWLLSVSVVQSVVTTFILGALRCDLGLELNARLKFLVDAEKTVLSGLLLINVFFEIASGLSALHHRESFHLALPLEDVAVIYFDLNVLWSVASLLEVDGESAWHELILLNWALQLRHNGGTLECQNNLGLLQDIFTALHFDCKSAVEVAHIHSLLVHFLFYLII